jgi:hypothetical protein
MSEAAYSFRQEEAGTETARATGVLAWPCGQCTYVNTLSEEQCEMCVSPNPTCAGARASSSSVNAHSGSSGQEIDLSDWEAARDKVSAPQLLQIKPPKIIFPHTGPLTPSPSTFYHTAVDNNVWPDSLANEHAVSWHQLFDPHWRHVPMLTEHPHETLTHATVASFGSSDLEYQVGEFLTLPNCHTCVVGVKLRLGVEARTSTAGH